MDTPSDSFRIKLMGVACPNPFSFKSTGSLEHPVSVKSKPGDMQVYAL